MSYGMGKSRNWEIILWFISWKENITPYCTLKMRHLRHCTKWICLIQRINWEIVNAALDIASPSTVNIILLSYLLQLYIFLPKCCSIQKLFKILSVRFFLGEQMKHSKCASKALRRPLKLQIIYKIVCHAEFTHTIKRHRKTHLATWDTCQWQKSKRLKVLLFLPSLTYFSFMLVLLFWLAVFVVAIYISLLMSETLTGLYSNM